MVYVHSERVKHLKVTWTYHDDRIIDEIIFVDESELPIKRTFVRPTKLRYSLCTDPIAFAISLYQFYHLQKSFEKTCLKQS